MVDHIERGQHGLYYLTDTDNPAIFVVAATETRAAALAKQARHNLHGVDGHDLYHRDGQHHVLIPDAKPLTPKQRGEVLQFLFAHIAARFTN